MDQKTTSPASELLLLPVYLLVGVIVIARELLCTLFHQEPLA